MKSDERDPLSRVSTMHWAHCTEILYSTARIGILDDREHRKWNQILLLLSEFTAVPSKGVDDALGRGVVQVSRGTLAASGREQATQHRSLNTRTNAY